MVINSVSSTNFHSLVSNGTKDQWLFMGRWNTNEKHPKEMPRIQTNRTVTPPEVQKVHGFNQRKLPVVRNNQKKGQIKRNDYKTRHHHGVWSSRPL